MFLRRCESPQPASIPTYNGRKLAISGKMPPHRLGLNHSLCHGDLGNLETVLTAAQVLRDAEYQEYTERLAAMILDSIETQSWLTGIPLGRETLGLMTGIARIGYELLRLAAPESVPRVLRLEEPGAFLQGGCEKGL